VIKQNIRLCRLFCFGQIIVMILAATAASLGAQQSRLGLQITSPADGTVVHPGQTVKIHIISNPGTTAVVSALIGEDPLGVQIFAAPTPAQISLTVGSNPDRLGKYMVTALGTTTDGQQIQSQTILLDVERPDQPTQINASSESFTLVSQGQQTPLKLYGTFADGRTPELTESSKVTFSPSDRSIVDVDADGIVTAVGEGTALITATYGQGSKKPLTVSVRVTVEPPIITPSLSSLSFGTNHGVPVGSSASASITLTNRTVNPTLGVNRITVTGDFSETDNCISSFPLAAGGSCVVKVTFSPTAAGSRTGSLTIGNNFTVVPAVIPLSGIASKF
jgi:hypothetical protein